MVSDLMKIFKFCFLLLIFAQYNYFSAYKKHYWVCMDLSNLQVKKNVVTLTMETKDGVFGEKYFKDAFSFRNTILYSHGLGQRQDFFLDYKFEGSIQVQYYFLSALKQSYWNNMQILTIKSTNHNRR